MEPAQDEELPGRSEHRAEQPRRVVGEGRRHRRDRLGELPGHRRDDEGEQRHHDEERRGGRERVGEVARRAGPQPPLEVPGDPDGDDDGDEGARIGDLQAGEHGEALLRVRRAPARSGLPEEAGQEERGRQGEGRELGGSQVPGGGDGDADGKEHERAVGGGGEDEGDGAAALAEDPEVEQETGVALEEAGADEGPQERAEDGLHEAEEAVEAASVPGTRSRCAGALEEADEGGRVGAGGPVVRGTGVGLGGGRLVTGGGGRESAPDLPVELGDVGADDDLVLAARAHDRLDGPEGPDGVVVRRTVVAQDEAQAGDAVLEGAHVVGPTDGAHEDVGGRVRAPRLPAVPQTGQGAPPFRLGVSPRRPP